MKKSAEIYSDDEANPVLKIQIFGDVEKFVTIIPRAVRLRGFIGDPIKKAVTIIPEEKYAFKITGVRARNGKYIKFQLDEVKNAARTEYSLTIENVRTDEGRYSDLMILETDSEFRPEINLRVYGNLRQRPAEDPAKE